MIFCKGDFFIYFICFYDTQLIEYVYQSRLNNCFFFFQKFKEDAKTYFSYIKQFFMAFVYIGNVNVFSKLKMVWKQILKVPGQWHSIF